MADWNYTVNTMGNTGKSVFSAASYISISTNVEDDTITFTGSMPFSMLQTGGTSNTSESGSIVNTTSNYGFSVLQNIVSNPLVQSSPPSASEYIYSATPSFRWETLLSISDPMLQIGRSALTNITGNMLLYCVDLTYTHTNASYSEISVGPPKTFSSVTDTPNTFMYWNVSSYYQKVTVPSFSLTLNRFSTLQKNSTIVNLVFSTFGTIETYPTFSNLMIQRTSPYLYNTSTIFADQYISTHTIVEGSFRIYQANRLTMSTMLQDMLTTTNSNLVINSTFTLPNVTPIPVVANLCFLDGCFFAPYDFYTIQRPYLNTNVIWLIYKTPSGLPSRTLLDQSVSSALFFYDSAQITYCGSNKKLNNTALTKDVSFVNTQENERMLQLPSAASNIGRMLTIKDVSNNASTNPIFVYEPGNSIDRTAGYRILQGSNNPSITFISNGSNWYIKGYYHT